MFHYSKNETILKQFIKCNYFIMKNKIASFLELTTGQLKNTLSPFYSLKHRKADKNRTKRT